MKIKKEDIPVIMEGPGTIMRKLEGFGNMDAIYHEFPEGTDFTPLLKGLPNDSCHCPHWGYIFEGAFRFIYDDGTVEVFEAGDMFYAPAGHTAIVDKALKFIDFSPSKENNELMANVGRVMSEMGGQSCVSQTQHLDHAATNYKATIILRFWVNDNPVEKNALPGTVDRFKGGLPYPFVSDVTNSPLGVSVTRPIPLSKEGEGVKTA